MEFVMLMNYCCWLAHLRRCPGASLQVQPFRIYCCDNLLSESVDYQAGIVVRQASSCLNCCCKAIASAESSSRLAPGRNKMPRAAMRHWCGLLSTGVRRVNRIASWVLISEHPRDERV